MSIDGLPPEFESLAPVAVAAIRQAYAINAERHDPAVGDDAVVFGIAVYRNSWHLIEQEVAQVPGWGTDRPSGSLEIVGAGLRIHVYRYGHDEDTDLHGFRLDSDGSSATQRRIAETNTEQLRLDIPDLEKYLEATTPTPITSADDLRELVIVHAGNPDEGCGGIWVGAPVVADVANASPWAWIEPLWTPGNGLAVLGEASGPDEPPTRHNEMPEPELTLRPVVDESRRSQTES